MLPPIPPEYAVFLVVGAMTLMLAGWLFFLDPANPVNRIFSLLLFLRGTSTLFGMGRAIWAGEVDVWVSFFRMFPWVTIPVIPVTILFLSFYPRRRGWFGTHRAGPWILGATTVALLLWHVLDPGAYYALHDPHHQGLAGTAGPLFFIGTLTGPILAVAAFVLARDYRRQPAGSTGYSMFLVAAALAINALADGVQFLVPFVHTWATQGSRALFTSTFSSETRLVPTLASIGALPLGIAALTQMGKAMRHERLDDTLQEARRFLTIGAPVAIVSMAAAAWLSLEGYDAARDFTLAFWRLTIPLLITYSLLRFSLFDADIRLKAGMRRAIVMTLFTVAFFVVSEAGQELIQGERGAWVSIAAAVLISLAAHPMQTAARRAADAIMPDTANIATLSPLARERMYHDQFLLVSDDGTLTRKERRMLEGLSSALGLAPARADALECASPAFTDDDTPLSAPQRRTVSLRLRFLAAGFTAVAFGVIAQVFQLFVPASDFVTGLLAAALIASLLGPIENLAGRLLGGAERPDPAGISAYTEAADHALSDGELSRRDRLYLKGLAERLGVDGATKRSLDRRSRARHGVRRWWPS